jgi:hypothetical protein
LICNAEARTELCRFFFIFFFRWSSGSERVLLGAPQVSPEISLAFFGLFSDGVLRSEVAFLGKACKRVKHLFPFY